MTGRRTTAAAAVLVVAAVGLTGGCRERVCRGGEHAVRSVQAPDTGRTCVPDGDPPPPGYEEFPPGQVPVYVD